MKCTNKEEPDSRRRKGGIVDGEREESEREQGREEKKGRCKGEAWGGKRQ